MSGDDLTESQVVDAGRHLQRSIATRGRQGGQTPELLELAAFAALIPWRSRNEGFP
jgi:hypothetical protein